MLSSEDNDDVHGRCAPGLPPSSMDPPTQVKVNYIPALLTKGLRLAGGRDGEGPQKADLGAQLALL